MRGMKKPDPKARLRVRGVSVNLQRLVLTFKPDALEVLDVERGGAA